MVCWCAGVLVPNFLEALLLLEIRGSSKNVKIRDFYFSGCADVLKRSATSRHHVITTSLVNLKK